jgi:hypothetical protein
MQKLELLQERIKAKANKYKEQGFADKEFRTEYQSKKITMTLSNNVFEQNKLLNFAVDVLSGNSDNEEKFLKDIAANILVDGKELLNILGQKDFELPQLLSLCILYYSELLAPLSLWRDIVAKEMLQLKI